MSETAVIEPIMEPIESLDELKKGIRVPEAEFEAWLKRYDWTWQQLARNEFPVPFDSFAEFQLACICSDPLLWCQAFLREPEDPDNKDPYNFFDFQVTSLRNTGDTLHSCASEVGKTREIVAKCLYRMFNGQNGSGLIGAPQQTHLSEIIDAMLDQFYWNKELGRALIKHEKSPHHLFRMRGFKLYFRPAGHDGEAFRNVHVKTFAVMEEAAKLKNRKQWSEFFRAMKPACALNIYSVPDGDRSCEFFRLAQEARGESARSTDELDEEESLLDDRFLSLYQFSKEEMPPPYWTDKRRRKYIKQFGGETAPEYVHNILGVDGDPENPVFPWYHFSKLLKDIPAYRCLKVVVNEAEGTVSLYGTKISGEKEDVLTDRRENLSDFDLVSVIKSFFSPMHGVLCGGADFAYSPDPTEIIVKLIMGKVHTVIARLHLESVTYDQQDSAINALDDIYDGGKHIMGWGLDLGSAGSAVYHNLMAKYPDKKFDDRATGYMFESAFEAVDEEGNVIMQKGQVLKKPAKELATDFLTKKMQRQELEYPFDPDITLYYPNHTSRAGSNGRRIYKGKDDHIIDADRALTLRALLTDMKPTLHVEGHGSGQRLETAGTGGGAYLT